MWVVATENQEIIDDVQLNGGQSDINYKKDHKTGTDRIHEALEKLNDSTVWIW